VLDCSSMMDIDSTALHVLKDAMNELKANHVQLFFACMKGPIRDAFKRCGVVDFVGENHFFWSVHKAVEFFCQSVLHQSLPDIDSEPPHDAVLFEEKNWHSPQEDRPVFQEELQIESELDDASHHDAAAHHDDLRHSKDYSPLIFHTHEKH